MVVIHYVCSISLFVIIINTISHIMAEDWKSDLFRANISNKINEAIASGGHTSLRSGTEMENYVFLKANTKEKYLGYVAKLILHLRDTTNKNEQQQQQEWQTAAYRENVVSRINDAIASTGLMTLTSGSDMENCIFSKATTKQSYLGYLAKLLNHMSDSKNMTPPVDNCEKDASK